MRSPYLALPPRTISHAKHSEITSEMVDDICRIFYQGTREDAWFSVEVRGFSRLHQGLSRVVGFCEISVAERLGYSWQGMELDNQPERHR
jgi:hypothetical protein